MVTKDDIVSYYKREVETTIKVLRAVPEGQLDYRPHDRSSSVKDLLRTFIAEMEINISFLKGEEPHDTMKKVPEFDFLTEGIASFDVKSKEFIAMAESVPGEDYEKPLSAWGMNSTRGQLIFMMLMDMVHHRGQLSVYVRLAGGKVPAIYGPSADDNGGF